VPCQRANQHADHGEQGHGAYTLSPQYVRIGDRMYRTDGSQAYLWAVASASWDVWHCLCTHFRQSRPLWTYTHVKE
jgi:hypothetical protein